MCVGVSVCVRVRVHICLRIQMHTQSSWFVCMYTLLPVLSGSPFLSHTEDLCHRAAQSKTLCVLHTLFKKLDPDVQPFIT